MMIGFGREVCGHLDTAERREWLVTNGIGGYASGTIAGLLTRRYHGLLIAALDPPLGRTLLLTKLDEMVAYAGDDYPLYTNRWASGLVSPRGYVHLERFRLEGTTPVWDFSCADALLEKRVWMEQGANTTYVRYDLRRASLPLTLTIKAIANYRDHHGNSRARGRQIQVEPVPNGLRVIASTDAVPFYLLWSESDEGLSDGAEFTRQPMWYTDYFLAVEAYRGLEARDDNLCVDHLHVALQPGESLTFVVSTSPGPDLDGKSALARRRAYEQQLLEQADVLGGSEEGGTPTPSWRRHLSLAADQFVVGRELPDEPQGRTIIAGYPWFGDWGRDTMISLPGLTLATGRHDVAESLLRTFARFVDRGMLPNRFPDEGGRPEYNTADATLWYLEAVRAYYAATDDEVLLGDLFPLLSDIVAWHVRGTRYNIHLDSGDGLLYAGAPGVQLTWMDAKVGEWAVTSRIGKPVEINALWYNGLRSMAEFARELGEPGDRYREMAEQARVGFARFWNEGRGCLYDVLDGPEGPDGSLRPNQLLAVSLPYSPLGADQQRSVVDVCARRLLTSYGLRSLSADESAYVGHYGGDRRQRDAAYHQGTVWGWLIGPFVTAHLRVYADPEQARLFLRPLINHLADHGVGTISEIFDGDPPFTPRGCIAQAWSVAEVLRAWEATQGYVSEEDGR
ncbi:MAG: amylo-alpha-1,6-glucosidase [Anaerolineae bacterium]|jgi:predicted glycogen debranching enzyme